MSGFFRENNNLAFKNRANIFAAKLRPVAASDESLDFDSSGIMEEGLYSEIDNKNKKSDDLEITEVRLLDGESTVVKDKSHDTITKATNIKTGGGDLNLANQENSNDVLLEAFTNTQRICSNLKQQLVKSHKENSTLKTQLSEFENKTKQLNDKLGEYKKLLSDLKESLNSVKAMKEAQEHTFDEYKSKQATITQKLKTLKTEMEQMNGKLKKSNETVRINETELQNKRKEIDYLKRELDETSGLLSEEKIKNNKIFSMLKEEKESMLTYWNKNLGNQQVYFGILLKSLQDGLVSEIHQKTQDTYSTLAKKLKDNFQLQISTSTNNLKSEIQLNLEDNTSNIINELQKVNESVETSISGVLLTAETNINNNIQNVVGTKIDGVSKLTIESKKQLEDQLKNDNLNISDRLKEIFVELDYCKNELNSGKLTREELDSLRTKLADLEAQKVMNLTAIGQKDAQYEELMTKYNETKGSCEGNKKIVCTLESTNETLTKMLEERTQKLINMEEKLTFQEATYENKLISQAEIIKSINTENTELKNRIGKIEEERRNFEQSLHKNVDKIEKLNTQVQNMNVEMVQLKAQKLELEEENNNIKLNVQTDNKHQELTESELKLQKQKIIELTAKNQDLLSEKLELQDQIDNLNSLIKRKTEIELRPDPKNADVNNIKEKGDLEGIKNASKKNKPLSDSNHSTVVKKLPESNHMKGAKFDKNFDANEIKRIDDIFDLSSSHSEPDLEYTSSSFLPKKNKLSSSKGNKVSSKYAHLKRKKKLIEDDDFVSTKPLSKKRRMDRN